VKEIHQRANNDINLAEIYVPKLKTRLTTKAETIHVYLQWRYPISRLIDLIIDDPPDLWLTRIEMETDRLISLAEQISR
jgi:hypothetical protein